MLDAIVKGGILVTSSGRVRADLGIEHGRIASIGSHLGPAKQEYDASSLYVMPGLVDVHVHFREPGMEYKEDFGTGSLAAAAGGVTTVFDMPNTEPPVATGNIFEQKRELASQSSYVDFGLYGVITQENEDDLQDLHAAGAMGLKLFMGETTGRNPCPDDGAIFAAFRRAAALGMVVGVHAENDPVLQRLKKELREGGRTDPVAHLEARPSFVEAEAVGRAITLASAAGCRLHIHHLSTREGERRVRQAKRQGECVTCEALISHLLLDDSAYGRYGNLVQLNPPIRGREHVDHLWQSIEQGTIDCIATDHAPHSLEEQRRTNVWEGVGGFIGVETLLPLLLDCASRGRLAPEKLVRLCSENPARIYGLYPRKGALTVGSDADLVLVDPASEYLLSDERLHSKHPVSPYDGWSVRGRPVATLLRGQCIFREGEAVGQPAGQMIVPGADSENGAR